MGTSGAPDPCDDMPAREAGRPAAGHERYKAIAVRAGHPATWAEGLAGPMGRSTHRDASRRSDEQGMLKQTGSALLKAKTQRGCRCFDPGLSLYETNKHRTQSESSAALDPRGPAWQWEPSVLLPADGSVSVRQLTWLEQYSPA